MRSQQPVKASGTRGLYRLLASTGVSIAGQGMVLAAVPLLAVRLTSSPIGVSLTVAASYAAWLLIGLPAGALVDRWPRRLTLVVADLVRAAILGLLALAVVWGLANIWVLVVAVFLVGAANCFFDPAAQAALPSVVGRDAEKLASANGRMWSLDLIGRTLIGPPVGAALFVAAVSLPFLVNAGTFVVSALLLAGLGRMAVSVPPDGHPQVLPSVRSGLTFLWGHPELRTLTVGMAVFNLTYNIAYSTFVLYAKDRLQVSDQGFGFLLAASAVGGLIAAYVVPKLRRELSAAGLYALGLSVQGVGWFIVWLVPNAWVAGVAIALVGMASMTVTVLGGTARQRRTPDELLGRISATTRVAGIGSAAIGALLGGVSANWLGIQAPVIIAAVVVVLAALLLVMNERAGHED